VPLQRPRLPAGKEKAIDSRRTKKLHPAFEYFDSCPSEHLSLYSLARAFLPPGSTPEIADYFSMFAA
jgi:hypothetical protein